MGRVDEISIEPSGFAAIRRTAQDRMTLPKCLSRGLALALLAIGSGSALAQQLPYPILFVTQFPVPGDFASIGSVFANHRGSVQYAGRGGDLYIRYPSGALRNLTQEAGFGNAGFQGANSISVRDPAVSWDGTKAVFSMTVGATTQRYVYVTSYFQLYEVTGLGQGQTASIVKVPNQPTNRNNVSPTYMSDNSIVFVSDRTRNGAPHLYPQLDEYESTPTPTGLWRLQPDIGKLTLLQHSPSGSFDPLVDSFGRVLFTRWDHLQRDQQADNPGNSLGAFNYSSEKSNGVPTTSYAEIFPESRGNAPGVTGFTINHFFPWVVNQDGSDEETINHIGRHELHRYFERSFTDDSALIDFTAPPRNEIANILQMQEDPITPGRYVGIDAPEFYTHASGQIVRLDAPPTTNPSLVQVTHLNARSNRGFYDDGQPPADFTGHYRDPLPLSDGRMIAAHTAEPRSAGNDGSATSPDPRYKFRLKRLATGANNHLAPVENLTPGGGITKSVSYWSPDDLIEYNGPFWELSPVEVRPRTVPPATAFTLKAPEQAAFTQEGVNVEEFRSYLRKNGLSLVVMRNVTTRDRTDKQQPYNLRVPGGTQTVAAGGGRVYDISHMQFFQADQIRGLGGANSPSSGRRVLAQTMHDTPTMAANLPNVSGPPGSVPIASDGSVALFVPASRAMAWHSTSPSGTPVVRERYWVTFQPGEIRACDGCHGVNQQNQATPPQSAAQNTALALRQLLARWRDRQVDLIFTDGLDVR